MTLLALAALLGAFGAAPSPAGAQLGEPVIDFYHAFERPTGALDGHRRPDVAMNQSDVAVVWIQDASGEDVVWLQRYRYGTAATFGGGAIEVTSSRDQLGGAAVSIDEDGGIVVAWNQDPSGANNKAGFARVYDFDGAAPQTDVFRVTGGNADQTLGGVAVGDDDHFVVVWSATGGRDTDGFGIYSRRYNYLGQQDGSPGSATQVNSNTNGDQRLPEIAIGHDGGEGVIVWASDANPDVDPEGRIAARRLPRGSHVPTGSEIVVAGNVDDVLADETSVDMADNGTFVAGWSDVSNAYLRAFDSSNNPLSGRIRANRGTGGEQNDVDVGTTGQGGRWVATWEDEQQHRVEMRSFTASGAMESNDIVVGEDSEWEPAIAMRHPFVDQFVVFWHSEKACSADGTCGSPHIDGNAWWIREPQVEPAPLRVAPSYRREPEGVIDRIGNVRLGLLCPRQQEPACSFEVGGTYEFDRGFLPPGLFRPGLAAAAALDTQTFQVPSGSSTEVSFRLPGAARTGARRGDRVRARFAVTMRAGDLVETVNHAMTLRPRQTEAEVGSSGKLRVRVHFDETGLAGQTATVALADGSRTVARARVAATPGKSRVVGLRLGAAQRRRLAAGRRLKLSLLVTVPNDETGRGVSVRVLDRRTFTVTP